VVLLVGYLAMTPLTFLIYGSFQTGFLMGEGEFTLDNYIEAYTDREFYGLFLNSLIYAVGVSILTFLMGTSLAWVCERTNTPGRSIFPLMAIMTYMIPGVLTTIAYILLLSPRIGLFNTILVNLFDLSEPPLNIYNFYGMIWAAAAHLYPLNFLLMSAAFRSMDSSLEEAALAAGANHFACFRHITLRIMRPAILSVMLILFIRGIESFEVPALVGRPAGIFVFTTKIYEATQEFPPLLGLAGAYAAILLLISIAGVYLYQRLTARAESFSTITGKGYRPRVIDLGRWKYLASAVCTIFLVITLVLPVLGLLTVSFSPYTTALTWDAVKNFSFNQYHFVLTYPAIIRAFRNSALLALSSATIVMFITSIIAWITVRTQLPGKWLIDGLTFIPIAIPGVIMGVSIVFAYLILPIPIYGTLWILLVAYITLYMPYGIRVSSATIIQIHKELEEASTASGASWWQTFSRIVIPLFIPGLLSGWIYVAIISLRELSASIFLVGQGTEVLSTIVFDLWDSGNIPAVAALGVLMTLFLALIGVVAQRWQRSVGILRG
jgi:iron(III) transport system permease protein